MAEKPQHQMPDPRKDIVTNPSSASRPKGKPLEKPTVPWEDLRLTEFPPEARALWPEWGLRWVRIDKDRSRIEEMQGFGWLLCERPNTVKKRAGGEANVDGTDISGCWTRRGCVLMRLHPDRVKARAYHQRQLIDDRNASIDQRHEQRFAQAGAIGYGTSNLK